MLLTRIGVSMKKLLVNRLIVTCARDVVHMMITAERLNVGTTNQESNIVVGGKSENVKRRNGPGQEEKG